MFAIEISGPDDYRESLTVGWDEYNIGRAGHNELVLAHPSVAMRHVRLLHRGPNQLVLEAFHTDHGTWVDGEVINAASRALVDGSRVRIGDYELVFSWVAHETLPAAPVSTEAELITAIERHDPESRTVYADWLEEQGQTARAEFLRVEQALLAIPPNAFELDARIRRDGLEIRLRELATVIDPAWRVRVACPRVLGCEQPNCAGHWGALDPTEVPHVRACSVCARGVVYCSTGDEARAEVRRHGHYVLDVLCPHVF